MMSDFLRFAQNEKWRIKNDEFGFIVLKNRILVSFFIALIVFNSSNLHSNISKSNSKKNINLNGLKKNHCKNVKSDPRNSSLEELESGKDKDGYLFSFHGDSTPSPIVDFDLKDYFPLEARKAGIKNKELIALIQVDETGKLNSAKIVSGKAGFGFDEAALKVVHRAKYNAGCLNGKPVKMVHRMQINFLLHEEE